MCEPDRGLCRALREMLLRGHMGEGSSVDQSYLRVVNAMQIDPTIFLLITGGVLACAMLVAAVVAYIASRADPIELLD